MNIGNNNKKNILIITVVISLVIFIIMAVVYMQFGLSKPDKTSAKNLSTLIKRLDKSIESIKHNITINDLGARLNESHLLREEKPEIDTVVSGILSTPQKPLAVINNKVVGLGDEIDGFKVIDIKEKSVTLIDKNGNKRIFHLYEEEKNTKDAQ